MSTQNTNCFNKGNYESINDEYMNAMAPLIEEIKKIQKKFKIKDNDTLFNAYNDSTAGKILGFDSINTGKHGFDCKTSNGKEAFLESKVASWSASSIAATFNDTTIEKANAFKGDNVWLALSVCDGLSDLMFICYGQNKKIGEFLEKRIIDQTNKNTRRTQTISLSALIFDYGFKIVAVNRTKEEVYSMLTSISKRFQSLDKNIIVDAADFKGIKF